MKSNTAFTLTVEEPMRIGMAALPDQALKPSEVRIKTLYSGISAGTEMTAFMGSNPYLEKRWNPDKKLFENGTSSWSYPMPAIGYEEVGEIVELGKSVTGIKEGQLIWGFWGHKSHHVAEASWVMERFMPKGLDAINGIYSQIGGIALNAVLDSNVHLGERVAVFGQGVPGLMVTQLLKASGAEVIAVDRLAKRLDAAKLSGADHVVDGTKGDVAEAIKKLTGGRGADVCIEITGSYHALHDAIRSVAYNSRVVVSGFFQGDGKGLRLGEEFHHNRIDLVCSQIGGVNPSIDHRWNRLRLDQTVMNLLAQGKIDFKKLISHTFKAKDAQAAFDILRHTPNDALQIVLDFTE
jgi:threonine dehydrogenase-like Zn-dependent dehydrogenase